MIYYLITHEPLGHNYLEVSTIEPVYPTHPRIGYFDIINCDYYVEEFKNFSAAKKSAIKRLMDKRESLAMEQKELRALRKKDINQH